MTQGYTRLPPAAQQVRYLCRLPSSLSSLLFVSLLLLQPQAHAQMKEAMQTCTACHGKEGRASSEGYYPRIAGKPEGYLYNQLQNFKEGRRNSNAMVYLVAHLPDAYLKDIAQYFSSQDIPYPPPQNLPVDASTYQRGYQLVSRGDPSRKIPACNSCHGELLTGMNPSVPGLLGLPRDYLNAQLGAWVNGSRRAKSPDCMASIAKQLNDQDISAVTGFLALQPVKGNTKQLPSHTNIEFPSACGSAPSKGAP